MYPHITILPTTRIPSPLRIHRNGIQRSKMPFYSPDFLLENLMIEACFEFPLAGGSGCDVHGCLAAAEDYKVFFRGDGCGVERGVGGVRFKEFEAAGGDYLWEEGGKSVSLGS